MKSLMTFLLMNALTAISLANASLLFHNQGRSCIAVVCNLTNCAYGPETEEYVQTCQGVNGNCISSLCNNAGCAGKSRILDVVRACKGTDGHCIQRACTHGHCKYGSNLEAVTSACRGFSDTDCLRVLCNNQGDCHFLERFVRYANLCAGN